MMTVMTTLIGLLPILWATEAGSRIMKRLATPMIGGLITSTILTLVLIPIVYEWLQQRRLRNGTVGPFHNSEDKQNAFSRPDPKESKLAGSGR